MKARRHLIGERVQVVLHVGEHTLALGEREWAVVEAMDGTRDLEGVRAAARAAGVRVGPHHVTAFVERLGALGLLAGADPDESAAAVAATALPEPTRPIRSLPGYGFRCDGTGSCCRIFGSVLFTPLEAARARAAVPEVLDAGHDEARAFTPSAGIGRTMLTGAMRDGACVYLDAAHRCRIHARAGAAHKPFGCRTFPARFVDTGAEIRVTPRPECACVFDGAGEAPLTGARAGAELPPETFVPNVPTARMGPHEASGAEVVAFFDALAAPEDADRAAWLDALADEVGERGLGARGDRAPARAPTAEEARARLARLDRRAPALVAWRSEDDLARRATGWLRAALAALVADPSPPPRHPAAERLYVRAMRFGAWPAEDGAAVEADLRERAARLRIARALAAVEDARAEPAARHPIALVEALARGHGLGG